MEARFVKCIMNCGGFAGGVMEGYLDSCLVLDYQQKVEKTIDIYQLIVYNISRKIPSFLRRFASQSEVRAYEERRIV